MMLTLPALYVAGYRTIPVVGWLFLLQVIAAFGLGLACWGPAAGSSSSAGWLPRGERVSR